MRWWCLAAPFLFSHLVPLPLCAVLRPPSQSAGLVPVAPSRWRGDYGGKKQLWFPANYVEEISSAAGPEQDEAVSSDPALSSRDKTLRGCVCSGFFFFYLKNVLPAEFCILVSPLLSLHSDAWTDGLMISVLAGETVEEFNCLICLLTMSVRPSVCLVCLLNLLVKKQ